MSNAQRLPEIDDLIQDMIDLSLFQMNVSFPGRITGIDHATGKATIQLELKAKLNGEEVSRAPLQDVPIGFFRAGGFRITLPSKVNDKVWVFFADRALDDWLTSGDETLPRFKRIHSMSDAFALPQAYTFNDPTPIDPNDAVMGLEDGSGEIRIKPDGSVEIKGDGNDIKLESGKVTINSNLEVLQ